MNIFVIYVLSFHLWLFIYAFKPDCPFWIGQPIAELIARAADSPPSCP